MNETQTESTLSKLVTELAQARENVTEAGLDVDETWLDVAGTAEYKANAIAEETLKIARKKRDVLTERVRQCRLDLDSDEEHDALTVINKIVYVHYGPENLVRWAIKHNLSDFLLPDIKKFEKLTKADVIGSESFPMYLSEEQAVRIKSDLTEYLVESRADASGLDTEKITEVE